MPTKPTNPIEEGDLLDDAPELNERLRKLTPDDPGYDAWLKNKYGHNPYIKAPEPKVKVKRRKSNRPRRS